MPHHTTARPDMGANGPAARAREVVSDTIIPAPRAPAQVVRRVRCECMLDRLFHRANSALNPAQYRAGLRFRGLWRRAARQTPLTQSYRPHAGDAGGRTGGPDPATWAVLELNEALSRLTPPQRRAVIATCGMDEPTGLRTRTLRAGLCALDAFWRGQDHPVERQSS
ncbi:hypothetical protein [Novacetimonas pomaceti]|nr:hypothetical protein [Novacetimonas pomaceti]